MYTYMNKALASIAGAATTREGDGKGVQIFSGMLGFGALGAGIGAYLTSGGSSVIGTAAGAAATGATVGVSGGAAAGATAGSIIPGAGTLIGGAIGAGIGLLSGLLK